MTVRDLKPTCAVSKGILLAGAYAVTGQWESGKTLREFDFQAARFAEQVQESFTGQEHILEQLDAALSLSDDKPISREHFRSLGRPSLKPFPMLQAIEWVPEVPAAHRRVFEASQKASYPEFAIYQRNAAGESESGSNRSVFYPVTYIEPLAGNEKAMGFDLGSHPARQAAVVEALRTGDSVASEPLVLVQEEASQAGILLVRRIRSGALAPGVVLAVLRIDDLLQKFLAVEGVINVTLRDRRLGQLIYGEA
ncbi:MAG: CHASE domain-containing protein, partial [Nitrospira sp.]|nr:CHASE domain-containing protein [Nitrospira sp.]